MQIKVYPSKKAKRINLMFSVTFNGFRERISTGINIPQNAYNEKNHTIKSYPDHYKIKTEISEKIAKLDNFENYWINENVSPDDLNLIHLDFYLTEIGLRKRRKFKNESVIHEPVTDYQYFINGIENGSILNSNKEVYSNSSIHLYRYAYKNFKEYCQTLDKQIEYTDITKNFLNDFIDYLLIKKKSSQKTVKGYFTAMKVFFKYGYDKEFHKNNSFEKVTYNEETGNDYFALNSNDIEKIENLTLQKTFNDVRILFLIQCFTGLRFSDLKKIKSSVIDEEKNMIRLRTTKTKASVEIPITKKLRPYLNLLLNDNIFIPSICTYNIYIKDICKLANLDEEVTISEKRAGKDIEKRKKKYDLISSHTARRTFITLSLKNGIPTQIIMKVTGHKTTESFKKYIKFVENDISEAYKNFDF